MANQQGYLFAVHSKRPSEVFVGLGGFKLIYPLVERVVKSNLVTLGRSKPAAILSMVFLLLRTLAHCEPQHIKSLFRKRNLIPLLRFCLLRIGKHGMMTQELLIEVKNVLRKNVLATVRFIPVKQSSHL